MRLREVKERSDCQQGLGRWEGRQMAVAGKEEHVAGDGGCDEVVEGCGS